jgi:hypothetical protein
MATSIDENAPKRSRAERMRRRYHRAP